MNAIILNILCEGQTEENFVSKVLKPYLKASEIIVKPQLLVTSRKKKTEGGLFSYRQAKRDLILWFKQVSQRKSETHYFTTMLDLYELPNDFPGVQEAQSIADSYTKVQRIEKAFADDIQMQIARFIPYIQLHEFEALLFCDIEKLKDRYPGCKNEIDCLKQELTTKFHDKPELVNSGQDTAPSKRIIQAIEGTRKYHYNKPNSGAYVTAAIGMEALMSKCPHFAGWVEKLLGIVGLQDNR
ncbi:MAG: DUF4276 family protein [Porphyromonadaceae bacterium]|nr:DUF4276 family protein [Porphyromonadaceae bacterium]